MSDSEVTKTPADGLISRLAIIDGRPLGDRAAAFAQIHDELRSTLEDTTGH